MLLAYLQKKTFLLHIILHAEISRSHGLLNPVEQQINYRRQIETRTFVTSSQYQHKKIMALIHPSKLSM